MIIIYVGGIVDSHFLNNLFIRLIKILII